MRDKSTTVSRIHFNSSPLRLIFMDSWQLISTSTQDYTHLHTSRIQRHRANVKIDADKSQPELIHVLRHHRGQTTQVVVYTKTGSEVKLSSVRSCAEQYRCCAYKTLHSIPCACSHSKVVHSHSLVTSVRCFTRSRVTHAK